MRKTAYYREIVILLEQFLKACFEDTVIKRINKERKTVDKIKVRYVYGPKQNVLLDLSDKEQVQQLPAIAVKLTSLTRDKNRVYNKIDGSHSKLISEYDYSGIPQPQPVPVNLSISVSIVTKYQEDMDQIVSNFVPYTDPYFFISYKNPYIDFYLRRYNQTSGLTASPFSNEEVRAEVLWNETISYNYPVERSGDTHYHLVAETAFTIKGWLYKEKDDITGRILKISNDFVAGTLLSYNEDELEDQIIESMPRTTMIYPYEFPANTEKTLVLNGYNYENVSNVYLSGGNLSLTSYSPFASLTSGYYTASGLTAAFSGTSAAFSVQDNNTMTVTIPPLDYGIYDLILLDNRDKTGYSIVSTDIRNTEFGDYTYPASNGLSAV